VGKKRCGWSVLGSSGRCCGVDLLTCRHVTAGPCFLLKSLRSHHTCPTATLIPPYCKTHTITTFFPSNSFPLSLHTSHHITDPFYVSSSLHIPNNYLSSFNTTTISPLFITFNHISIIPLTILINQIKFVNMVSNFIHNWAYLYKNKYFKFVETQTTDRKDNCNNMQLGKNILEILWQLMQYRHSLNNSWQGITMHNLHNNNVTTKFWPTLGFTQIRPCFIVQWHNTKEVTVESSIIEPWCSSFRTHTIKPHSH